MGTGEKAKSEEFKAAQVAAQEAVVTQQQDLSETADAFRGVHLDPNSHHWDEVRHSSAFHHPNCS